VNGESKRLKVRVRWYGDLAGQIDDPILELKFKNNLHIGKLTYPLKGFPLDRDFSIQKMRAIFKESGLPDFIRLQIAELNFSLMNRYRRKYFLSGDGKFRVTVDDNLSVYDMFPFGNSFKNEIRNHFAVIVELKYNNPHEENADFITGYFPFRLTRNSKYVAGLQRLNI